MVDQSKWPAGIRPRDGSIEVRVRRRGYNYREIIQGNPNKKSDLAAAVRHRAEIISRINLGLPVYTDEQTEVTLFADDVQRYVDQLELEYSTVEGYLRDLNHYWLPVFGKHVTQEITTAEIKAAMKGDATTRKRWLNRLTPLRGVFDYAEVVPNPAGAIKRKKAKGATNKNQIIRFTPQHRIEVMQALGRHDDPQVPAYFALLFGCGLRPSGEPLGLEWVDYDGEQVYIHKTIVRRRFKSTTKTHTARHVFVPQWVRPYLDNLPSRFADGHIFLNSLGRPFLDSDMFNAAWQDVFYTKRLRRDLKIHYQVPYVCRHTRAAELLSSGVEPGRAAKQLGHSLKMFFDIYSEWIEEYANAEDKAKLDTPGPVAETKLGRNWAETDKNAAK